MTYQFVTLTRHPNRPELDSALLAQTMAGHLALVLTKRASSNSSVRLETTETSAVSTCSTFSSATAWPHVTDPPSKRAFSIGLSAVVGTDPH